MLIGDVVNITAGPFAGVNGLLKGPGPRVRITIDIGGRKVDVEMDADWVTVVRGRKRAIAVKGPAVQSQGKGA